MFYVICASHRVVLRGGTEGGLPQVAIRRGRAAKWGDKGHQSSHDIGGGKIAVRPGRRYIITMDNIITKPTLYAVALVTRDTWRLGLAP